jgi:NAD+ diphosphatase
MSFISSYTPPECLTEPAWWFIFQKDKIVVRIADSNRQLPQIPESESLRSLLARKQYLGILDGIHCYAAAIEKFDETMTIFNNMSLISLRELFGMIPDDLFWVAARASLIMYWDRTNQFCGQCGKPTQLSTTERAKVCTSCGFTIYPRISPAVIVAVVKDKQILLAHSNRFPQSFYSVLAGFVEPGETFEECVKREVKEESGIDVNDIQYFSNQPWPFPDSLMIAFTAKYAGGEICVDNEEVSDAQWFSADKLPDIPGKISVARKLIDWFVENYK